MLENVSINNFIDIVFESTPKPICTYNLIIRSHDSNGKNNPFGILMSIFIRGAKKIFGESITPQEMNSDQFELMIKYMLSMGYRTKYNYTYLDDHQTIPYAINIWFEEVKQRTDCTGRRIFL